MSFFSGRSIMVTGGAGFLGSHITALLHAQGAQIFVPRRAQYDFTDRGQVDRAIADARPEIIIHCAAFFGGMRSHELYPARIYYENLVMGAHLMEAARLANVQKFVSIGTDCSYPGYLPNEVLSEADLWSGLPHETALDYGLTKKILAIQGWAYARQYGFRSVHLILTNMYGPGDSFHPDKSHVVAALIRKFVEAVQEGNAVVEVWGSGRPTRNFLYVEDAARNILLATEKYDDVAPMNLTCENGSTVANLAETIAALTGFTGQIMYNTAHTDGQMKKILDVSRMKQALGLVSEIPLTEGLRRTIEWYRAHKAVADAKSFV